MFRDITHPVLGSSGEKPPLTIWDRGTTSSTWWWLLNRDQFWDEHTSRLRARTLQSAGALWAMIVQIKSRAALGISTKERYFKKSLGLLVGPPKSGLGLFIVVHSGSLISISEFILRGSSAVGSVYFPRLNSPACFRQRCRTKADASEHWSRLDRTPLR